MRLPARAFPFALLLFAAWLSSSAAASGLEAQALSGTEARIVQEVDAGADEAIALLERLVSINSGTMNLDGVREVGAVLLDEFDALGFETEWVDGAAFDRAGHVVARREGSGPHLLLIGHLDTVFEPGSPFQTFERAGDRAAGPVVVDMKGGDVVIIHALKALQPAHLTALLSAMERDRKAPRLRQMVYTLLHTALRDAVKTGLLARNPAAAVDRPRVPRKEIRALDPAQVRTLLEQARGDSLEALYVLAVASGLRLGELVTDSFVDCYSIRDHLTVLALSSCHLSREWLS